MFRRSPFVLPSSRANVRMVEGSAPRFRDEITSLLRQRLRALALIMSAIGLALLLLSFSGPLLVLRLALMAAVVGCFLLLRGGAALSLPALRCVEVALFASFAIKGTLVPTAHILRATVERDAVAAALHQQFNLGAWALFVVCYGLIIPNNWWRTLLVALPASLIPYLNHYLLGLYEPAARETLRAVFFAAPIPLPLVAVAIAVYGAHTLHTIRREAFKARQLGQYRLKERLGAGGMGEVFRAEHALLKRPCALKMIRPEIADADALERFEQEVQATAGLSHPNTVDIYDYGRTDEGVFYYVMELLPGLSLAELVERHGPLPPERAVHLVTQVCDALTEAHGLGLIHRDIKPANVFAARRGGRDDVAKLLDFGLVISGRGGVPAGEKGTITGSPPYLSPEQAEAGPLDARSDLYSLGAVAYYLVTGTPPFAGATALEHVIAHVSEPVTPPSLRRPGVPADLEQVIMRCLEKKADGRFASAAALKQALGSCLCAGGWDAERAAAWWRQPAAAVRPVESSAAFATTLLPGVRGA